jgi:hypothetical protein
MSTTPMTEEYRKLEAAIYDLKTEIAELHKQRRVDALLGTSAMEADHELITELRKELDEVTHLNQAISMLAGLPRSDEMDTLVKDGKRLDWILDQGSYWLSSREAIDKEMADTLTNR